jgi:hypothetical protein
MHQGNTKNTPEKYHGSTMTGITRNIIKNPLQTVLTIDGKLVVPAGHTDKMRAL